MRLDKTLKRPRAFQRILNVQSSHVLISHSAIFICKVSIKRNEENHFQNT